MLIEILRRTPPWVWLVLAQLVALGLWQLRGRWVRPPLLLALPLVLLGLGLWSLAPALVALPTVGLAWLAALLAAATAGQHLAPPAGTRWDAGRARLWVGGSAVPLVLILAVFLLRYTTSVAMVLQPAWRTAPAVQLPLALTFGALSGLFLGRAVALWRLARPAAPARLDNARA